MAPIVINQECRRLFPENRELNKAAINCRWLIERHSEIRIIFSTFEHQFETAKHEPEKRCNWTLFFIPLADWITIRNLRIRMNCCYSSSLCELFVAFFIFGSHSSEIPETKTKIHFNMCDCFDVAHESLGLRRCGLCRKCQAKEYFESNWCEASSEWNFSLHRILHGFTKMKTMEYAVAAEPRASSQNRKPVAVIRNSHRSSVVTFIIFRTIQPPFNLRLNRINWTEPMIAWS